MLFGCRRYVLETKLSPDQAIGQLKQFTGGSPGGSSRSLAGRVETDTFEVSLAEDEKGFSALCLPQGRFCPQAARTAILQFW